MMNHHNPAAGGNLQIEDRISIEINHQLKKRLINEKNKYKKLKQSFYKQFDSSPENQYFIISKKFIQQWNQFTSYNQDDLNYISSTGVQPRPLNHDITIQTQPGQYQLRPLLTQQQDFQIANQQIMNVFQNYPGARIKRKSFVVKNEKKVEIYPKKVKYIYLNQNICHSIDMGSPKLTQFQILTTNISNYANPNDFKIIVANLFNQKMKDNRKVEFKKKSPEDIRIWKLDKKMTKTKFMEHVQQVTKKQAIHTYLIQQPGNIFQKQQQTVEDFQIDDDDLLVFQTKQQKYPKQWVIKYGDCQQSCEFCRSYRILKISCGCKKVKYCSQQCRQKDIKFHKRVCPLAQEQQIKQQIDFNFSSSSNRGLTGLQNLGNTCFMNSCLQCLSNTQSLAKYFIQKRYVNQINRTNPIGTKGKLTIKYAKLIKSLWCDSQSSVSPYSLKHAIGQFQPMFSGYMQHDSQQLLSFLLDGLHEDLNKVITKPYVESIDSNGRSDQIVAKESWINYLKRNQSIIVNLFMGQYKSKVICPDCKFQSITFDPYSNVSLPIPQLIKQSIEFFVFYDNYRQTPKKITIQYKSNTINEWIQVTANLLKISPQNLKFFILTFQGQVQQITQNTNLSSVKDKIMRQKKNLFCIQYGDEQLKINNSRKIRIDFKIVRVISEFMRTSKETQSFKRPFFFDMNNLCGEILYQRIFRFLFRPVISRILKYNTDYSNENVKKGFQKLFENKQKYPFDIYLMTSKTVIKSKYSDNKIQVIYEKQKLVNMKDNIYDLIFQDGKIRQFEIQIRTKTIKQQIKKLNSYQDFDRIRRRNQEEQDKQYSLIDCFYQFQKQQKLQKGNQWYCPKCKQHKQGIKQMKIYKTPRILIIHLKRFKQKSILTKSKLTALIKYPINLDLKQFLINKSLPQDYFQDVPESPPIDRSQSSKYQLYAVSNHYGGMGGGHYTAYAKNNGSWYDFNDSSVHKVSQRQVISSAGYILFYKRI